MKPRTTRKRQPKQGHLGHGVCEEVVEGPSSLCPGFILPVTL